MLLAAGEGSVIAYADGSCLGNPGPGGWGVVLESGGKERTFRGSARATTNNRMEITAAIEALRRIEPGRAVVLRTDSQYVVNTMVAGWKRNANRDLWELLDAEVARRRVRFEWVRGHAADRLNEKADELARRAAAEESRGSGMPKAAPAPGDEVVAALTPLLTANETVQVCAGCGRQFVAGPGRAEPPATAAYCALAECQLKARRALTKRRE